MRSTVRSALACYGIAVLGLAVIASCGGDGPANPEDIDFFSDDPEISDLQIRPLDPERANTTVRYVASVHVFDWQDDVADGVCQVNTSVGSSMVPVEIGGEEGWGNRAECRFSIFAPAPGEVTGELRLFDAKAHRSNALAFVLTLR
jgi:hypothetical protein